MISALLLVLAALPQEAEEPTFAPPAFRVHDGLTVDLWATSPLLHNPTAIDVDARGRVWVTEGVRYRRWGGRNPGLERTADRVVIVSDEDGDGRAETARSFVEDPDLVSPLGILVLDGVVLVSASPNLFAYFDDDGDDVADRRETLLTGFGGFDHDHGLHSAVLGPDGALYLAVGNAGPHLVTDADGWKLASGSIYDGGGPAVADNKPGLQSSDGKAWTGGLMLRVERDGSGLRVLAHNFRNQYEVAVDPFGRMWTADNDDDGNRGVRATWVQPGGNHGYFSTDGTRYWQSDKRPGQTIQLAHWHAEDPGVSPSGSIYGAGSPTGVTYLGDGPLTRFLGETVLTCDAGRGIVFAWGIEPSGSGWKLVERRLLEPTRATEDGGAWFRPSDVALGPSGSIFVADWYDPAVGGHYAGDRDSIGHLYRVHDKQKRSVVAPQLTSAIHAIGLLGSPVSAVRSAALARIAAEPELARPLLAKLAEQGTPHEKARALWILGATDAAPLVAALQESGDARVREAALAILQRRHPDALPGLARTNGWASSPHGEVRRGLAQALRGRSLTDNVDLWLSLAAAHVPGDRPGLEAFGLGAEGIEELLWAELVLADGRPASEWDTRFEELAWRLHPAAATAAWRGRALEARLDVEERRRALDALAFTPGRAAAEAVVAAVLAGPEDLRPYARWWLEHRDANDWRAFGLVDQLPGGRANLGAAKELWRSEPIEAGVVAVDVVLEDVETLWLVVDAEGGNGHDWADWIDPRVEVEGQIVSLVSIPWLSAEAGWGGVYVDRNANDSGPLSIDGRELRGIGTHAPSSIAWAIPEGATRFLARAGLDDAGAKQPGAAPRVHFEVHAEQRAHSIVAEASAIAFDDDRSPLERQDAFRRLASDAHGGMVLVRRAMDASLSEFERAWIEPWIFNNPDLSVRALASAHFERPGAASAEPFPALQELLALEGDPSRGRSLFLSEQAQCSRCHTFESGGFALGADLGPDLSVIRQKFGRDGLFDAILNPSAAIAFGYETWMVEDTDGRLTTGFLLADGDLVVLKDTLGERHAIPAEEITWRHKQDLSTMPQGVASGLSPQDLADLVAFLAQEPSEPTFGAWQRLWNGKDLAGWTPFLNEAQADPADVWSVKDGALICAGRPIGYIRTDALYTNYQLELQWRFDPRKGPGNSGVLLRLNGDDKVWPDSIEAQLQHQNAGDIWNIGEFPMETQSARRNGRHTARSAPSSERPLGEWNTYRITLNHGNLELEVNGVVQNRAGWCAEIPGHIGLQSEGAEIHFRNVRIREIE